MTRNTGLKYTCGSYFRSKSHEYFPSLLQIPNIIIGQNLEILAIVVRAAKIRHASLCVIIAGKSSHHLCIFCSLIEVAKELSVSQVLCICVGFGLLANLTRDLSQAEKKIVVILSVGGLVRSVIFFSA